jgi:hypothetical protein
MTKDLGVDQMVVLVWILGKGNGKTWVGLIWLGYVSKMGSCEYCNDRCGSI